MGSVSTFDPVILPPSLYDRAKAEGHNMTGFVKSQPIPTVSLQGGSRVSTMERFEREPVAKMNRQQRRARLRAMGYTWAQARTLAKEQTRVATMEAELTKEALQMSPAEARQKLAEWAARGGK